MQKDIAIELIKLFKIPLILLTFYLIVTPVDEFIKPLIKVINESELSEIKINNLSVKFNNFDESDKIFDSKIKKLNEIAQKNNDKKLQQVTQEITNIQQRQKKNVKDIKILTIGSTMEVIGIESDGKYIDISKSNKIQSRFTPSKL